MNALIVGLGHIGIPKAKTYEEFGFGVYYYDVVEKETVLPRLEEGAVGSIPFDVIDICSPTNLHIPNLAKFLKAYPKALYLIEKTLCGTKKDLIQFKALVAQYPEARFMYSENCIFSTVFSEIERMLSAHKLQIHSVDIEFSKDRRQDTCEGRTMDMELEGFGRDIPHALMMLNELKTNISYVEKISTRDLVVGDKVYPRQGLIVINGKTAAGQLVNVYQSLDGDYSVKKTYYVLPLPSSGQGSAYRVIDINCGEGRYIGVQVEPIQGLKRFVSRIMYVENNEVIENVEVTDINLNALIKHVVQVLRGETTINRYVSVPYAVHITEALLFLNNAAISGRQAIRLKW